MSERPNQKILVIDDEPNIVELLKYNLKQEGYTVKAALNGSKGLDLAKEFMPDLILLDIMMPKQDGMETCRQMRLVPELKDTLILFLTARSEEYSEVAAFESGADDYIIKPIKPRALMSRITALLRRNVKGNKDKTIVAVRDLTIDRSSYTVRVGKTPVNLPKKEFELLYFLARHPDQVFNRDELLENIWGTDVYVLPRTVDVHIRKLREKIGESYITTIKGVGYKFLLD